MEENGVDDEAMALRIAELLGEVRQEEERRRARHGRSSLPIWKPPEDHMMRPPTEAEVWDMVAGSERLLRKKITRVVPVSRLGELDEIYSDVVIGKCQEIMTKWRVGRKGAWLTYLVKMCCWKAYKKVHGRNGHWQIIKKHGEAALGEADLRVQCQREAYGEDGSHPGVDLLLADLPGGVARLVRWRLVDGYDYDEIAGALGCSRDAASGKVREAIAIARKLLWQVGPAGRFLDEFGLLSDEL